MNIPTYRIGLIVAAALLLAACQTFKLAEAGKPVQMANAFTVTPQHNWNLAENDNIQTWTLDGPVLQQVQFFNGIESGKPLVEALSADRDRKPPTFETSMTALEVRDLFVATRARLSNINLVTSGLRPEAFGDTDGYRFEYTYTDQNGVRKKGFVKATTANNRLFLIDYSAVALYYFDRDLPLVESLVNSLKSTDA